MEFQAIQAMNSSSVSTEYVDTSDAGEYQRWEELNGGGLNGLDDRIREQIGTIPGAFGTGS